MTESLEMCARRAAWWDTLQGEDSRAGDRHPLCVGDMDRWQVSKLTPQRASLVQVQSTWVPRWQDGEHEPKTGAGSNPATSEHTSQETRVAVRSGACHRLCSRPVAGRRTRVLTLRYRDDRKKVNRPTSTSFLLVRGRRAAPLFRMKHRGCPGEIANGGGWDRHGYAGYGVEVQNFSSSQSETVFCALRGWNTEGNHTLEMTSRSQKRRPIPVAFTQRPAVVPGIMPRREAGTRPIAHRHPHTYLHRALLTNQRQCAGFRGLALSRLEGRRP